MQKQNYALAALDMDGTLLNTNHETTAYTREVLARAGAAGKITALATGRCLSELTDHLRTFSAVRYVINENGACVYDTATRQCVSRVSIDDADIEFIIGLCGKHDMIFQFSMNDQAYMRWPEHEDLTPYHIEDFRSVFDAGSRYETGMFELYRSTHARVDKVNLYFRTAEERVRMRKILESRGLKVADSIGLGLEMSAHGVTKATGLVHLCRYLNLPLEDTMAIGDASNDVEILQTVGLGVAMGNAIPEVMAIAGAVTEDCDHDGAAKAIERYMLGGISNLT